MSNDYATLAALAAATVPSTAIRVSTAAYAAAGDLGGANYRRRSNAPAHALYVQSADGAYWEIDESVVPPEAAGAKGDGVTDDLAALQRWHDWARIVGRRGLRYGPRSYAIGGAGIAISGYQWAIEGFEKATEIVRLTPGDCYVYAVDIQGGESSIAGIRFRGATGAYSGSSAIHFKVATAGFGVNITAIEMRRLNITNLEDGILFDDNGTILFGTQPIQNYYGIAMTEITTDGTGGSPPLHPIRYKAGPGAHCQVANCRLVAASGGYPIRVGNGTASTGDFDVTNNELLGGLAGIKIVGPSDPTYYNKKVSITGNDIDGSSAYTFDLENLSYGNVSNNNMLHGVSFRTVSCFNMRLETALWTEVRDLMLVNVPYPANVKDLFKVVAGPEPTVDNYAGAVVEIDGTAVVYGFGTVNVSQKWQLRRNTVTWLTPVKISENINPTGTSLQIAAVATATEVTFTGSISTAPGASSFTLGVKVRGRDSGYERL